MAAKKSKNVVPPADLGMAALIKAEQERLERQKAEFDAKWKPFKRKPLIGNEESQVATVHRIAEIAGATDLTSQDVNELAAFVRDGQLSINKDQQIVYSLHRAIRVHDDKLRKDFVMEEMPDKDMAELELDGFRVGMLVARGKKEEITQDEIRKIARGAIRLDEAFAERLPVREIMAIFNLYILFFLVR